MKRILLTTLALILLVSGGTVLASDISDAIYSTKVRATNTSTIASNVAANVSANTSAWIAAGILNSTATNAVIRNTTGDDTAFMPGYGSNPWAVWFSSVPATGSIDYTLFTNATGGKIRYFPGDGGMTVSDNDTNLELGDYFAVKLAGYFDALQAGNLAYKPEAFKLSGDGSGNVTASILTATPTNETLRPDGAGDDTNIANVSGAATHWQAVSDASDASRVYQGTTTYQRDLYTLADSGNTTTSINSATIYFRIAIQVDKTVLATPHFKIGGVLYTGTEQTDATGYTTFVTKSQVYNTSPATSAAWTWNEINNMQVGVSIKTSNIADFAYCSDVWVIVSYNEDTPVVSVSATGVSSGETIVTASTDNNSVLFGLGIDKDPADYFPITDGLVFNLPLHHTDMTGTSLISKDITQHTATVEGPVWGNYGRTFAGGDDRIYSEDNPAGLAISGNVTVLAWEKHTDGGNGSIVSKPAYNAARFNYDLTEGHFYVSPTDGTLKDLAFTVPANDGDWHLIGGQYSNPYLLGFLDGEANGSSNIGSFTLATTGGFTARLQIGRDYYSGWRYLNCQIGEVWIYNRALTLDEITALYNATKWRYDGTVTDASDTYFQYNALAGASVPDIDYDYTFAQAAVMPYMEYASVNVSGTLAGYWEWEYGATFSDLSANSNTATPTFRTASSDADVSAELVSFQPIVTSQASENVSSEWPSPYTVPSTPTTMYTDNARPTGIFFEPLVHTLWGLTDLPDSFFWYNFTFAIILTVGMLTQLFFAANRYNALLLKCIVMGAVMVFFALEGINIYGMYIVIYWALWCFGILVISRNYGW